MKKTLISILYLLFIFLVLPLVSVAQNHLLNGVVIDQANNAHLPFVKIVFNNKANTLTDINGMFSIRSEEPILQLSINYLGYQPLTIDATDKTSPLIIKLIPDKNLTDSLLDVRADTYHYIDSIIHKEQYAQMKRRQESLLSGEIEIGLFTLDLNRLKRYNQFEGVYLGLGGHTNEKLFRSVSFGGYAGYGFKDKKTKYGFDVSVWPDLNKRLNINAGYSYDTRQSGGSNFFYEKNGIIDPSTFRYFYVDKIDYEQKFNISVSLKQDYVNYYFAIQRRIIERGYDISNGDMVFIPLQYNVSGIVAGIRLAPGEKVDQQSSETHFKGLGYPILWFQYTRGVPGMFNGGSNFNRYEGKLLFKQNLRHLGRSTLQVVGNLLEGNAPYFEFFNGRGSYGKFGLYAPGSFVTMHPAEFMNDKSLGFFFTHNFGYIFPRTEIFNPFPALVFNYGWGKLQKNPPLYFLPIMDMHKGFVEAGLQINNLLDLKIYGIGLGAYYRMGAYSNATVKDNLVFKIVISFPGKD